MKSRREYPSIYFIYVDSLRQLIFILKAFFFFFMIKETFFTLALGQIILGWMLVVIFNIKSVIYNADNSRWKKIWRKLLPMSAFGSLHTLTSVFECDPGFDKTEAWQTHAVRLDCCGSMYKMTPGSLKMRGCWSHV